MLSTVFIINMSECLTGASSHSQTGHVSGSHASRENRERSASQRRGVQIEQQDRESIIKQNRTSSVELVKNRTRVLFNLGRSRFRRATTNEHMRSSFARRRLGGTRNRPRRVESMEHQQDARAAAAYPPP